MAFDKKEYWKNRKDGKRGQGETVATVFNPNAGNNRRQARARFNDHRFTPTIFNTPLQKDRSGDGLRNHIRVITQRNASGRNHYNG